jgi:uncharacterized membrane protein
MSNCTGPARTRRGASWYGGVSILAGVAAYQFFAHWLISVDPYGIFSEIFLVAPLFLVAGWFLTRFRRARAFMLLLISSGVIAFLLWRSSGMNPRMLYPLPNVSINLFMLWFFGRTLQSGGEALITRVAGYVHGAMSDQMVAYTRRVTWAWCVFFVGMIAASVLLFAFASLDTWSLFANLLSLPLVAIMFVGEYLWRKLRHPDFVPSTLLSGAHAFRKLNQLPDGFDSRTK